MLLDSLLGRLGKDERLLTRFVQHLFELPNIQMKIIEVVEKNLKIETAHSKPLSYADPKSNDLKELVKKHTDSVDKLTTDMNKINKRQEDLEQYSRRNSIIISKLNLNNMESLETQVCNFLNKYVNSPILSTNIDRTYEIKSNTNSKGSYKNLISIYRTKANILTKRPMEKLRADNDNSPTSLKVFISEDLTKGRIELF